jgi:hypothetical protein
MSTSKKTADLSEALSARLIELLRSIGRFGAVPEFERRKIERDLASLAKTDAAKSYLLGSIMSSINGDFEKAERSAASASALGLKVEANVIRAFNLANFGRATEALALIKSQMRSDADGLSSFISAGFAAGAVTSISRVVEEATAAGRTISSEANAAIVTAKSAARALELTGHSEEDLAAILDVAGEVQREGGLLWLDSGPNVIALTGDESEESGPGVHYYFRMDVTPSDAAAMSGEIGWRLVNRGLDRSGLTVSHVGTRLPAMSGV